MKNSNGGTVAPLGVLEEITSRLAALTEDQFILPKLNREKDATLVMMAPDSVKRLFTLREQLRGEHRSLSREMESVGDKAVAYICKKSLDTVVAEMDTEGSFLSQAKVRMEQFALLASYTERLFEIVEQIFWLEVRRQHSDLNQKPTVCIYSDWSLCWQEGKERENAFVGVLHVDLSELLGAGKAATLQ